MMLNPTGGVLGGDHLLTEMVQAEETHVCLTTPSATRVYRTELQPAVQCTALQLADRATLEYFPEHVIPHARSALRQSLCVQMATGSQAILFDALACGRLAHGERWQFREIDSVTEVRMGNSVLYRNRTWIVPSVTDPQRLGIMQDFNYMASLGVFSDRSHDWKSIVADFNHCLAAMPSIWGGASLLSCRGCVVRFLTKSAADLNAAFLTLWAAARRRVLELPPFDQRKY